MANMEKWGDGGCDGDPRWKQQGGNEYEQIENLLHMSMHINN